jgi:predicted secreted protein
MGETSMLERSRAATEAGDPSAAFGVRFSAPLALRAIFNPINTTMIAAVLAAVSAGLLLLTLADRTIHADRL